MKEAFEKIKERLEEKELEHAIDGQQYGSDGFYNLESDQRNVMQGIQEALSIVSEVEAECGKKQKCFVSIDGCDDSTQFEIDLSENEYEFLKRIGEVSEETSTYGCMPTLTVRKVLLGK